MTACRSNGGLGHLKTRRCEILDVSIFRIFFLRLKKSAGKILEHFENPSKLLIFEVVNFEIREENVNLITATIFNFFGLLNGFVCRCFMNYYTFCRQIGIREPWERLEGAADLAQSGVFDNGAKG